VDRGACVAALGFAKVSHTLLSAAQKIAGKGLLIAVPQLADSPEQRRNDGGFYGLVKEAAACELLSY
jgi:hypothetical protein